MADFPSRFRSTSTPPGWDGARDATRGGPRGLSAQAPANPLASAHRRERLREFQTGLSEKLRKAQNTPLAVNRLGIQIGTQRLLVDLADAGEILPVPDIAPVPLTKAWYRGLANVRGNLLGIVDLSLFAGGPATSLDKDSRVLAFSSDLRFSVGILVSRMLGLRSAADLVTAPAPTWRLAPPMRCSRRGCGQRWSMRSNCIGRSSTCRPSRRTSASSTSHVPERITEPSDPASRPRPVAVAGRMRRSPVHRAAADIVTDGVSHRSAHPEPLEGKSWHPPGLTTSRLAGSVPNCNAIRRTR